MLSEQESSKNNTIDHERYEFLLDNKYLLSNGRCWYVARKIVWPYSMYVFN